MPAPSGPSRGERHPPLDPLTVAVFVVGLAPWLGLAVTHRWDDRELGLAVLLVAASGRDLVRALAARLRRGPGRGAPEGERRRLRASSTRT